MLVMQNLRGIILLALALFLPVLCTVTDDDLVDSKGHHHHHHKGHKHHAHHNATHAAKKSGKAVITKQPMTIAKAVPPLPVKKEDSIVEKMKKLEAKLAEKAKAQAVAVTQGHLLVNGPLPVDFNERFVQAVGQATGTDSNKVKVTDATALEDNKDVVEVAFVAPAKVVKTVESEAADPESKLANGNMRQFLVAKETPLAGVTNLAASASHSSAHSEPPAGVQAEVQAEPAEDGAAQEVTPVEEKGIDIDTAMPYGDLEPFGREDTAQELTESSVKESDEMVDQLERAEVAEEKRSVFRALTRLRGAAITSFDGVARSQTGNIDEYNKIHKWRKTHPLHHLADEESDVTKWAFPDNADF
jgi:hypothetical protein